MSKFLGLLLPFGWLALVSTSPVARADYQPEAFYIDYRDALPFDIVTAHPRAIVHPESDLDAVAARAAGTAVYAYISVGEIGSHAPHREEVLALGLPFRGTNTIWNSDLVDFRDDRWEAFFVDNLARGIVAKGYGGFFLDTLDSINLDASAAEVEIQRQGLLSLIRRLHTTYPDHEIVTNRGFRTVPLVYDQVAGMLVESVYRGYDFENSAYVTISAEETALLEGHMNAARDAGLEIYVLDYVDPAEPALAFATGQAILAAGYHAFITTPPLTGVTLGPWLPVAPSLSAVPRDRLLRPGQRLVLTAQVLGAPEPEVAWLKDGEIVAGAHATTLLISAAEETDSGAYRIRLINRFGTFESDPITVSVDPNARPARLTNLSARVWSDGDGGPIIPGVVAAGTVSILARAIGPGLSELGVEATVPNPDLSVTRPGQSPLHNDDWAMNPVASQLAETAALVGAFPLAADSLDAALQYEMQGPVTLRLGNAGESGNALVELYLVPDETKSGQLANLSLRTERDEGSGALIVGFVLDGDVPGQVLIRAVGPGLANYGVDETMQDPQLTLYREDQLVVENRNWEAGSTPVEDLHAAFTTIGAFELVPGSNDAALLVELEPGIYTAHVRNAVAGAGSVLVEVYLRTSEG